MCQRCIHIETSHLICTAYQLTGFYMRVTLTLNGLNKSNKYTMEVRQLRVLVLEVFRSVNKLNFRASHLEHVTSRVKKRNIIRKYKIQINN